MILAVNILGEVEGDGRPPTCRLTGPFGCGIDLDDRCGLEVHLH